MINNAVIMGRLVKDPEERKTPNGKSVCKFCVAVDSKFNKEKTDFIDVVAFDKSAEFVSKYFRKGSMIAVQGRIATNLWEDKDGKKQKSTEISADYVSFCGGKNDAPATPTITPSEEETSGYREVPVEALPWE